MSNDTAVCDDVGSHDNPCYFVKHTDDCDAGSLIDYLALRYCLNFNAIGLNIFLLLWLLVLISLLATTADLFFVPSLQFLSKKLRLSPSVAGITLLALGNGAPDVFTAMAALSADDFTLTVSALIGASMCISSLVLGFVVMIGSNYQEENPNVIFHQVHRREFQRDVAAYVFAIVIIVVIVLDGTIYLWEALGLLGLYIFYVLLVVFCFKDSAGSLPPSHSITSSAYDDYNLLADAALSPAESWTETALTKDHNDKHHDMHDDNVMEGLDLHLFSRLSFGLKLQFIVEYPFSFLRYASVPSTDEMWSPTRRYFSIASPLLIGLLLMINVYGLDIPFGSSLFWNIPLVAVWLVIGVSLSLLIMIFTKGETKPTGLIELLLGFLAFTSAILWLNAQANETVGVLQSMGIIWGIDTAILGLTVLAIGNSVGDFVADTSVANKGSYATAVATCFGSPLLNDVVGLGISLTITCVKSYPEPLVFSGASQVLYVYAFLLAALISSMIMFPVTNYLPPKKYGFYLVGLYTVFIATSVYIETQVFN